MWLTQTNRGSGKVGIFKIFPFCRKPLLFTSISKEVIDKIGEKNGEKLIRKAVRKYGQQRGKRMVLRAKKNGHDLTVANFVKFSSKDHIEIIKKYLNTDFDKLPQ